MSNKGHIFAPKIPGVISQLNLGGLYQVIGRYPDGSIKWSDIIRNTITDEGITYALEAALHDGTPIAANSWFIGCIATSTPSVAAGDTMASHVGWTEQTNYDEATRTAWGHGAVSSKQTTNSTAVVYTGSSGGPYTFGGLFLASNATKGGTTGTLWGGGAFSQGDKSVDTGETISITYTVSGASS